MRSNVGHYYCDFAFASVVVHDTVVRSVANQLQGALSSSVLRSCSKPNTETFGHCCAVDLFQALYTHFVVVVVVEPHVFSYSLEQDR